jgi:hypothetical protein
MVATLIFPKRVAVMCIYIYVVCLILSILYKLNTTGFYNLKNFTTTTTTTTTTNTTTTTTATTKTTTTAAAAAAVVAAATAIMMIWRTGEEEEENDYEGNENRFLNGFSF